MGGTSSKLPKDLLSEYQVRRTHNIFFELQDRENGPYSSRVSMEKVLTLPELKSNPFRKRICHVFSTSDMKDGSLSFEDFLDLLSAFSDSATLEINSHYKHFLSHKQCECGGSFLMYTHVIVQILEESDIDKDGTVNLSEFQHVISRSPDFVSSFKIVL
uniref:Calcium and integrin binding 1 (calmyrin) n=1 Tax=Cyprinus carpio TaxID=7962 RepID=A0A8C1SJL0_CYPCA